MSNAATRDDASAAQRPKVSPAIKSRFISHGTLASADLEKTRDFYEQFLGLEVTRTSKISMMVRLGGKHVYAVVKSRIDGPQPRLNHNGIDVESNADVDDAYRSCKEQAEKWGLHEIEEPTVRHGTYSFTFRDLDRNCWEILSNPEGGYTWIFEQGDLSGKGHWDKDFLEKRPKN